MQKTIIDMQNKISTVELDEIIRHQFEQLELNSNLAKKLTLNYVIKNIQT